MLGFCDAGVALSILSEGLRPSDSPTRSLARRFAGALRSRGSLRFARSRCCLAATGVGDTFTIGGTMAWWSRNKSAGAGDTAPVDPNMPLIRLEEVTKVF